MQCDALIFAYDVRCDTSRADCKRPLFKKVNKIRLSLVILNVYQSALTHRMDHNTAYKYQVIFNFNRTTNLYEFVPPFPLYFNVKNAPNPEGTHFEKPNVGYVSRSCIM